MVEYLGLVRDAIHEGQASGIFRRDMPDKIAANCFFGALDEMVTSWVLSGHDYRLSNVADSVVDIFLNGMQGGGNHESDPTGSHSPAQSGRLSRLKHSHRCPRSQPLVRGKVIF